MAFQEYMMYNECQGAYTVISNILFPAYFALHKANNMHASLNFGKGWNYKLDFTLSKELRI